MEYFMGMVIIGILAFIIWLYVFIITIVFLRTGISFFTRVCDYMDDDFKSDKKDLLHVLKAIAIK